MTKRYSEQFKQEALNFVQGHPSLGIATVARQLGVGYSTLDTWLRQHRHSIDTASTQHWQCCRYRADGRATTHSRT